VAQFSDQIRQAIERSGMTRYRIAVQSGITESTISRFMHGADASTDMLDRLAETLGLNVTTGRPKLTPSQAQFKARAQFPTRKDR
jgi:transcriptional regulator with XRE-family HTH domain